MVVVRSWNVTVHSATLVYIIRNLFQITSFYRFLYSKVEFYISRLLQWQVDAILKRHCSQVYIIFDVTYVFLPSTYYAEVNH